MRESSAFQAILAEGEAEGEAKWRTEQTKKILIRLGRDRFGEPTPEITETIEAITDLERLERLTDRVLGVATWDDLPADP